MEDKKNEKLNKIVPFDAQGAWIANHSVYYTFAFSAHEEISCLINDYNKSFKKLEGEGNHPDYANHALTPLVMKIYERTISLSIFACMSFEAFINFYGLKRLGDDFYKRNIERRGITEKIALILASTGGKICSPNHPLIKKIRFLFDTRNSYVHPKSVTLTNENMKNYLSDTPSKQFSDEIINTLEEVIELFCQMDKKIVKEHEFHKDIYEDFQD